MLELHLPDLTFPMVKYGRVETPWDLRPLLYQGAAGANVRDVAKQIASGKFGRPILERIELVTSIHTVLVASLIAGGSSCTVFSKIRNLRTFWSWAEQAMKDRPICREFIEATYRHWTDFLLHRVRLKSIGAETAHSLACTVSSVLDEVLDRNTRLLESTRIRRPKKGKRAAGGVEADKQNLADTFAFGHLLLDIINGLSGQAIWGPLPVRIPLRSGLELREWSGLRSSENLVILKPGYKPKSATNNLVAKRTNYERDCTLRTRFPLANLRLEAELLVFISQTGMNLAQAHQLKLSQYSYKSTIDGYEVRDYKARKQGAVLFEIFAEYRSVFENYLAWRKSVFSDSQELFPFVRRGGRAELTPPGFDKLRKYICPKTGVRFFPPRNLRKTRINWLLRQSRNPDLTAELAQHTKETLMRVYEQPSLQVAMSEIIQFWPSFDPALRGDPKLCLAPGVCDGIPQPTPDLPVEAPKPDCRTPAGCLFCAHHRDIDSQDYVWSVACMRHLKTIVLQGFRPIKKGGADAARHVELALEVLSAKLKWFRESNEQRKSWVNEALERVEESDFHPHWRYLIESAQGV